MENIEAKVGNEERPDGYLYIESICKRAKAASSGIACAGTAKKNDALRRAASKLIENTGKILEANAVDVSHASESGVRPQMVDRLRLTEKRIKEMSEGMAAVAALPDPVGEVLWGTVRPNGMEIIKKRVPLGVIGIIFEARPNVTCDCSALTIKSGNAVILRGGKEAINSNRAIAECIREALDEAGLPRDSVILIDRTERELVNVLFGMRNYVDVLIPRGGKGLINNVTENSKIPVIRTGEGNCHTYIDDSYDMEKAVNIVLNAKTQRPSVCNAMETMLVSEKAAPSFLPPAAEALREKGVTLRCCKKAIEILGKAEVEEATELDFETEYNDLILAVKVVKDVDEAIAHINRYGTGHSEAIVTESIENAEKFKQQVDAACVYVNCSTRFTDGYQFGFGAEIGISNQKLHARGPMGLPELTSIKYVVSGNGQVRS
ncbi:MAG: glutamate-5-semialdehyde dehydrogenase [Clostridia bacterium]|nr:glutamate-5-semialdehyde dehydrogenase [Clostridia bacterium]